MNLKNSTKMKLEDIVRINKEGKKEITRGLQTFSTDVEGGQRVLTISIKDLENGIIKLDPNQERILKNSKSLEKSKLNEGDVLIGIRGSFRSAIVDSKATDYVLNQNLIRLKLKEMILPEVLVAFLNSEEGQQQLTLKSKGGTIPSITINDLKEVLVAVPPIEVQVNLKKYFDSIKRYEALKNSESELVRKITDTVITKYFGLVA